MQLVEVKPTIPEEARKPCNRPTPKPDADMTEMEVLNRWNRDRASLIQCEARRAQAVGAF